ncbi:MAG: hypothetical protein INR65_13675, partial [Gluconacetobacter diazotrophicus]|nr:hypothetical protein [Gluconacetobacter diazotrophicus]
FALSAAGAFASLHQFVYGSDGANPSGPLLLAGDGYLYGVTANGGPANDGTAFRVARDGTQTVLATFTGDTGSSPSGALVQGRDGNFYGVTQYGGASNDGTVFQMTPAGALTAIHSFRSDTEGMFPSGGLLLASDGYFYGVTSDGGAGSVGTVFRVDTQGSLVVLHSFAYDSNGSNPTGPLVQGSDGNFYGSLASDVNFTGHLFRMTPDGAVTLLYNLSSDTDGYSPQGGLVQGPDGSFYGTVDAGGPGGGGTLFNFTVGGAFNVLHALSSETDGDDPAGGLALAANGNLYGTAYDGGTNDNGTVYEQMAGGTFNVLHTFSALYANGINQDGANPPSALVQDADGNLYGVAKNGGAAGLGTVFVLSPVHPTFFDGEVGLGNGVFYLGFASGNPFGYYAFLSDPDYLYHFDLGYEYVFDAQDGYSGVYLYDFASSTFFYTSPDFPFPFLYDFTLDTVLYYFPDPNNPGHYFGGSDRYFYDFATGQVIVK